MNKQIRWTIVLLLVAVLAFAACNIPAELKDYTAPTINLAEDGITLSHESATKFSYKVDNGEWKETDSKVAEADFSKTIGSHTVVAKVVANDVKTAAEQTLAYTIKAVSLSDITVDKAVASWQAQGKTSIKVGDGEFVAATDSYTATENVTITVKAEAIFDKAANTFYVGEAVEKTASIVVVLPQLTAPQIVVNDEATGLVWADVQNAVGYMIKVNDGDYVQAANYTFATEAGNYTIKVKAIGDGVNYIDSTEATFSYRVKQVALNVNKKAINVAEWTFEGMGVMAKFGSEDYAATAETVFTAMTSGTLFVKAIGGYDEQNNVSYVGETEKSVDLVVAAITDVLVEDAENKEAADLADAWEIRKYDKNWVETSASITVVDSYEDNGKAMAFKCWANGNTFRYRTNYVATDALNAIKFAVKGSGNLNVKVQISNSVSGVYATYNLGKLPTYWQEVVIAMNDEGWKINFDNKDYTLSQVLDGMGMVSVDEVLAYTDTIGFILNGSTTNGASATVAIDNLCLANIQNVQSSVYQPLFVESYSYIGGTDVAMQITVDTVTTLSTVGLETDISQEFTPELDGSTLILKDNTSDGAGLTIVFDIIDNGGTLVVKSVEGAAKETYESILADVVFSAGSFANVKMDFEEYTSNVDIKPEGWTMQKYASSDWVEGGTMRSRAIGSTRVVNMVSSGNTTTNYTYTPQGGIGLANMFSVKLSNHWSGAKTIKFKISVVDANGTKTYLFGGTDFAQLPVTKGLVTLEKKLDKNIDIKSITFTVQGTNGSDAFMYVDDVVIAYNPSFRVHVCQSKCETCGKCTDANCVYFVCMGKCGGHSQIEHVDSLTLDFEDGTLGSPYVSANWTQEIYKDNGYQTLSGKMNCRSNDGTNKLTNFSAGYSMLYRYTYNDGKIIDNVNTISFKFGNYFDNAQVFKVKLTVLDEEGNEIYVIGAAGDNFAELPVTTKTLVAQSITLPQNINVSAFRLYVKSAANSAYLYVDDIVLSHVDA